MNDVFKLDNGITVVSSNMPEMLSAAVGVWINVGSAYEGNDELGAAHFIEHMLFRGTRTRSSREISSTIGRLGGYINAFTSREYTCYFARVEGKSLSIAIELLSDMLMNSTFSDEHIEKERDIILDELLGSEDDPDERVYDNLMHYAFDGDTFGEPIVGTREIINTITKDNLLSFMNRYYTPENIVIAVAGGYDENIVKSVIKEHFSIWNKQKSRQCISLKAPFFHSGYVFEQQNREQVYITIAYQAPSLMDDQKYALMILDSIVGSGSTSRLFQKIREEEGLTYSIDSHSNSYKVVGLFEIDTSLNTEVFSRFIDTLLPILESLSMGNITEEEVEDAKSEIIGSLVIHREGTEQTMMYNGEQQLFFNDILSMNQIIDNINAVSVNDVKKLSKIILGSNPVLSVVGNTDEILVKEFYEKLCFDN